VEVEVGQQLVEVFRRTLTGASNFAFQTSPTTRIIFSEQFPPRIGISQLRNDPYTHFSQQPPQQADVAGNIFLFFLFCFVFFL
jgi:hypothetical protein